MFSYVLRRNVNSRTYMFYVDHYELVHDILHAAAKLGCNVHRADQRAPCIDLPHFSTEAHEIP